VSKTLEQLSGVSSSLQNEKFVWLNVWKQAVV